MNRQMEQRMEPRFPALMTISTLFKVIAIIVGILGIIAALASLFATVAALTKFAAFIGILFATAVQVLVYWAIGDFLAVFVSIEHNTYMTKEAMQKTGIRPAA